MLDNVPKQAAYTRLKVKEIQDPWAYACVETQQEIDDVDAILASLGFPKYKTRKEKHYPKNDSPCGPPSVKDAKTKDYMDYYVFPSLFPAIESLLKTVLQKRILQCRWSTFSALDYISEYLYNFNPLHPERRTKLVPIYKAPFALDWLSKNPRNPLPSWVTMSPDDAAIKIQSLYRGFGVRKRRDVSEMRQFWKAYKSTRDGSSSQPAEIPKPLVDRTHSLECYICADHFHLNKRQAICDLDSEAPACARISRGPVSHDHLHHLYTSCCFSPQTPSERLVPASSSLELLQETASSSGPDPKTFKNLRLKAAQEICEAEKPVEQDAAVSDTLDCNYYNA